MFDKLAGVTCGLMLVPFQAFFIILYLQHGYIEKGTYRLTVLSTRAAFFLPGYALLLVRICYLYYGLGVMCYV
jgi:hypothetical protein